jgi:hypothetical protein
LQKNVADGSIGPTDTVEHRRERGRGAMDDIAQEPVVAHNDPSPARERVLRLFEEHHIPLKLVISLPSLDGIKRAVELKLGGALLPRRCAITEIASGSPRRRPHRRGFTKTSGDAGLPQGPPLACRGRVPVGGSGEETRSDQLNRLRPSHHCVRLRLTSTNGITQIGSEAAASL